MSESIDVGVGGGVVVCKLCVACTCFSGVVCCRVSFEAVDGELFKGSVGCCVSGLAVWSGELVCVTTTVFVIGGGEKAGDM